MQKEFNFGPRVKTLDFGDILRSDPKTSYLDKIVADLKVRGIYREEKVEVRCEEVIPVQGLLYRGFNANRIQVLLKTGSDTTNDLCGVVEFTFRKALEEGDKKGNPFSYAGDYAREKKDKPAMVVFDVSKMRYNGGYVWELPETNPASAIVAVYILKNLDNPKKPKQQKPTSGQISIRRQTLDNLDQYCLREARSPSEYQARIRRKRRIHADSKQLELF